MKKLYVLTAAIIVFLSLKTAVFAAAYVQNVSVSPGTVAPGDPVTVSFEMRTDGLTGRFAIAYSDDSTLDKCQEDWLADDKIYNRAGASTVNYWVNGVSQTATAMNYAGNGPRTGITGNSTTTFRRVDVVTYVPPEKSGNFTIYVLVRDNDSLRYDCSSSTQGPNNTASTTLTVSGATVGYKLNLTAYGSSSSDRLSIRYRITNYSESAIKGSQVAVRYYMNHSTQSTGWSYNNANWQFKQSDGTSNGNNYQMTTEFVNTSSSDCPDTGSYTRQTNMYARMYYTANANVIAPNGGYLDMSQDEQLVHASAPLPDATDDYSRAMDFASLDNNKYMTLFYNPTTPADESIDVHLCEYTSPATIDSLSGEQPCGLSACTKIQMDKSASPMDAYVGDTITYCITYTNRTGAAQTFNIWDTVPAVMTYIGCNSCSVNYYGDTAVVYWTFSNVADGTTGSVCFWAKVASYPYREPKNDLFALLESRKYIYSRNF